jgi:lipoate-protein ligase A
VPCSASEWRLVDDIGVARDAAAQMDADLACLDEVAAGAPPVLRFYRWSGPALSLGRFQPEDDVDRDACWQRGVEVVRRPTGGRALLHGADLTYAVAMPRPAGEAGHIEALYRRLAGALIAGLAELGVTATIGSDRGASGPACFSVAQGADLRVGDRKLCGSAQVQRGGVVLQHGSILLDRLPFDELDLLHPDSRRQEVEEARRVLRARSVTLRELGVEWSSAAVASAIAGGFVAALDLEFVSRVDHAARQ